MTGGTGHGDNQRQPVALEERCGNDDDRLSSPSATRNRGVIRDVFLEVMPLTGRVLEIASGTGEHCVHILQTAVNLHWIASDLDEASRLSVAAWAQHAGVSDRLTGPLSIDASAQQWNVETPVDGMFCCNMIHIAPWAAGVGLLNGAGRYLRSGGRLFLYGPFSRNGVHISDSNVAFDASLRQRDPAWGVRDLENDVLPVAASASLELVEVREMPSNNLAVILERT